jgi:branched-chain amino acid transport system substrate-binding protein
MKKTVALALALACSASYAFAQDGSVKIGVLNDQSSSFSALGGTEVVRAVELAIKDYGGQALGKPIELVSADHQNKPEVGLSIARQWMEQENVDVIADMANSAIALGVNTLIGDLGKVGLFVSPLTDKTTEADCNGHVVAWAYDAHSTFTSPPKALLAEGVKTFFILSPDYEAGKVQEATEEAAILAGGGTVIGKIKAPLGTTDFSSYLLQAQSSGAEAMILNVSGPDLVNAVKQIQEFGIMAGGMKVALPALHQADARAIGVEAMKGVRFAAPWFWTKDEASRNFGLRMKEITGNAPGWVAAGTYSAVTNYLKAVDAAGTDEPKAVLKALHGMKIEDFFVSNSTMYPNGRLVHDMYYLQVKAPEDVKEKDDFFQLVATVPAAQAFKPYSESVCKIGK